MGYKRYKYTHFLLLWVFECEKDGEELLTAFSVELVSKLWTKLWTIEPETSATHRFWGDPHLERKKLETEDYMVDVDTDQASVRGQAKFIWRSTGKSWQDGMAMSQIIQSSKLLTISGYHHLFKKCDWLNLVRIGWKMLNMTMLWSRQMRLDPLTNPRVFDPGSLAHTSGCFRSARNSPWIDSCFILQNTGWRSWLNHIKTIQNPTL